MDISERGVMYKFELSARNDVDFGDVAVQTIRTPDGSTFVVLATVTVCLESNQFISIHWFTTTSYSVVKIEDQMRRNSELQHFVGYKKLNVVPARLFSFTVCYDNLHTVLHTASRVC